MRLLHILCVFQVFKCTVKARKAAGTVTLNSPLEVRATLHSNSLTGGIVVASSPQHGPKTNNVPSEFLKWSPNFITFAETCSWLTTSRTVRHCSPFCSHARFHRAIRSVGEMSGFQVVSVS